MVYILEAHASNEWPINNLPPNVEYLNQHITLEDRQNAAKLFQNTYGELLHPKMKFYLDSPTNEFNTIYPSWPFRVWIINKHKKIELKGMANADIGYTVNLFQIRRWIHNYNSFQQYEMLTEQNQVVVDSNNNNNNVDNNNNVEGCTIKISQSSELPNEDRIDSIENLQISE